MIESATLAAISRATDAFVLAVDPLGKTVETGTRGSSAKESFAALLGEKELAGAVKNPRMAARKRRGGPNGEEFAFTTQLIVQSRWPKLLGTDAEGDRVDTLVLEWGGRVDQADAQRVVSCSHGLPFPSHLMIQMPAEDL